MKEIVSSCSLKRSNTSLTGCENRRTSLTAVRYGFTVASSIAVYAVTWLLLGTEEDKAINQTDQLVFR